MYIKTLGRARIVKYAFSVWLRSKSKSQWQKIDRRELCDVCWLSNNSLWPSFALTNTTHLSAVILVVIIGRRSQVILNKILSVLKLYTIEKTILIATWLLLS